MKKRVLISLFAGIFLVLLFLSVFAAEETNSTNTDNFTYTSVDDFFNDIPAINQELQSKEIFIPDSAGFLIKNGNIFVTVEIGDGVLFYPGR